MHHIARPHYQTYPCFLVQAWFQHDGHITFQLKSIQDGKISGFSQTFGKFTLDIAALAFIEFNIYDHRINSQR